MYGKIEESMIMYKRDNYKVIKGVTSKSFIAYPVYMQEGLMVIDRENGKPVDQKMWKESLPVEY